MSLPDQTPKLPKWPFLLSWALLLSVAAVVAWAAPNRYAPVPLISIFGCVALAAVALAIPFLSAYAHTQDEALDERQRSLDALARTVTTSAEQISIAANGLNEIAELTQKALRHADHLPQKLHEKMAELQAQLANVNDAEKEELEKEVLELRAAESERLQSTADKIAKSAAEWTKLEAATQKHLAAANDALAQTATTAEQSIAKVQAAVAATLDQKLAAALATLDTKIAELEVAAKKLASLPTPPPTAAAVMIEASPATITSTPPATEAASAAAEAAPVAVDSPAKAEAHAHPPKRPRKPRRTEPAAEEAPPADAPAVEEPPPVIAQKIPEVSPAAPETAEPFVAKSENGEQKTEDGEPKTENSAPTSSPPSVASLPSPESPKPPRKRAPKKPAPEAAPAEPEPSLGLDEPPPPAPAVEVTERALSSDGATRLLVTAYIGIGNRLFIRGEGPGLTWEKGVPLQFVSIGKWRWETANATAPVKFKLYKNDETECTALGTQSLDPGQQQEMTAAF